MIKRLLGGLDRARWQPSQAAPTDDTSLECLLRHERYLEEAMHGGLRKFAKLGLTKAAWSGAGDSVAVEGGGAQSVLILGPAAFREGVWQTRAEYILPDIFGALRGRGEIHWITGFPPPYARDSIRRLCRQYGIIHHVFGPVPQGMSPSSYRLAACLRIAREIRPSVITNAFGGVLFGYYAGLTAAACGARCVVRIPGDEIDARKHMGTYENPVSGASLSQDLERQAIGLALSDAVIAMSPAEQDRLRAFLPAESAGKVHVSIRGVDLAKFSGQPRSTGQPVRRVVFVGRNSHEKGIDILREVAAKLADRGSGMEILVAGDFAKEVVGNINYLGRVAPKDLPELYRKADVFLSCSRTEGFPQALAEALAMGLPVLAPAHIFGGYLGQEKGVMLTDITADSIVAALDTLAVDAAKAETLSHDALSYARNSLDATRWSAHYSDIVFGGKAPANVRL